MHPRAEMVYLNEFRYNCMFGSDACKSMIDYLQNGGQHPVIFFRYVGYFLHHTSAISRLLWPGTSYKNGDRKRIKQRGTDLRNLLGICDLDHPLKSRTLRNHFEHMDERLDDWVDKSVSFPFVNNIICKREEIQGEYLQDEHIFKFYDPDTNQLIFRGESFDVKELSEGFEDIRGKIMDVIKSRNM